MHRLLRFIKNINNKLDELWGQAAPTTSYCEARTDCNTNTPGGGLICFNFLDHIRPLNQSACGLGFCLTSRTETVGHKQQE